MCIFNAPKLQIPLVLDDSGLLLFCLRVLVKIAPPSAFSHFLCICDTKGLFLPARTPLPLVHFCCCFFHAYLAVTQSGYLMSWFIPVLGKVCWHKGRVFSDLVPSAYGSQNLPCIFLGGFMQESLILFPNCEIFIISICLCSW